jgi:hypothetical protein
VISMKRGLGHWLVALVALAFVMEGWLTRGALTQSTLIAATGLRGIRAMIGGVLGRLGHAK